jgi:ribosomal protein S18 acetylase RimI-like enzyme
MVPIELGPGPFGRARLVPLPPSVGPRLAAAIVAMPPWSVMAYPAERLAKFLATADAGARRHVVEVDGREAGLVSVRDPWLKGPYLELLALLPLFQRRELGSAILAWLGREAVAGGARNLWVCASSFNEGALRFYERHGFRRAAILPGLVADGYDEILLRKFPL